MNKTSTILSIFISLFIFFGFVMSDPHGSKTNVSSKVTGNSPVYISYGTPVYSDNFNSANDTAALRLRGYKFYNRSVPVGSTMWFQGNPSVFYAYNGDSMSYVGANYNATTGAGNIDVWLILPRVSGGIIAGDSLFFYTRSTDFDPSGNYPDSVRVMYSVSDSSYSGSWTELNRFKVPNPPAGSGTWYRYGFRAPSASLDGRFAIRYCVVNAGPSGANSDYIGIDALTIERTGVGINPISSEIPSNYSLSQNYPNPFNPATVINFSLPKSGLVTLKVYDILGKEVAELLNGVQTAGIYNYEFNASNLTSGVYFYKFSSGDFTAVKRMMLVK